MRTRIPQDGSMPLIVLEGLSFLIGYCKDFFGPEYTIKKLQTVVNELYATPFPECFNSKLWDDINTFFCADKRNVILPFYAQIRSDKSVAPTVFGTDAQNDFLQDITLIPLYIDLSSRVAMVGFFTLFSFNS